MAHLPELMKQQSRARKIQRLMDGGLEPEDIAKKLAPNDERKQQTIMRQIRRLASESDYMQIHAAQLARGELILGMPGIAAAVVRRAKKGNIPAAKLAMEASGFYSPKSQIEHTGDIKVTINNAPRPEPVVDAEVVEE